MDNRSPALARDFPSKPQLLQAIRLIGSEIEKQPLKSSSLARIMRESFGGSDAGGAWSWRMAYDLMQAATVPAITHMPRNTGASCSMPMISCRASCGSESWHAATAAAPKKKIGRTSE